MNWHCPIIEIESNNQTALFVEGEHNQRTVMVLSLPEGSIITKITNIKDAVKAYYADQVKSDKFLVVSRADGSISILLWNTWQLLCTTLPLTQPIYGKF